MSGEAEFTPATTFHNGTLVLRAPKEFLRLPGEHENGDCIVRRSYISSAYNYRYKKLFNVLTAAVRPDGR